MGLLDLFYERDNAAPAARPSTPAVNTNIRTSMPAVPMAPSAVPSAGGTKFDGHFAKIFEKMNLPGPDYYEWTKAEAALLDQIPNEAARRAAVFSMLRTQGLDRSILLDSAAKYRVAVDADIQNYDKAVAAKLDSEIGPKRAALENARATIQREEAEIARLQAGIAAARGEIARMEQELSADEAALESAKAGYSAARDAALRKIDADVAYITNTIT